MIIKKYIFQMIGRVLNFVLLGFIFRKCYFNTRVLLEVIFQQKGKDTQKIFGIHLLNPTFIWNLNWHIATTTPNIEYIALNTNPFGHL
jgi:hypothetical protein